VKNHPYKEDTQRIMCVCVCVLKCLFQWFNPCYSSIAQHSRMCVSWSKRSTQNHENVKLSPNSTWLFLQGLLDEWTSKAPAVQDINSKGSALCSIISVLTSPAKAKIHHNSGIAKDYFKILHKHLSRVSVQHDHSVNSIYISFIFL